MSTRATISYGGFSVGALIITLGFRSRVPPRVPFKGVYKEYYKVHYLLGPPNGPLMEPLLSLIVAILGYITGYIGALNDYLNYLGVPYYSHSLSYSIIGHKTLF